MLLTPARTHDSRVESLSILRDLETQGLYEALQQDIEEALGVEAGSLHVSSGANPAAPQHQERAEEPEARLQIDQRLHAGNE